MAEVPDNVFVLEECPHDWLFPQCSALVSSNLYFLVGYFEEKKKEENALECPRGISLIYTLVPRL